MSHPPFDYSLEALREELRSCEGRLPGHPPRFTRVQVHATCASTNTLARALARGGAVDGTVVIAGCQSAGRGRLDRAWLSLPEKGVYASLLLRPRLPEHQWGLVPLAAGLCVAQALIGLGAPQVDVKWPNDVRCEGRKIAGILCEHVAGHPSGLVVGLGINVGHLLGDLPGELSHTATSLRLATGRRIPRERIIAEVLGQHARMLAAWEESGSFPWETWTRLSALEGKRVRVEEPSGPSEGFVEGVDADGALLLRLEGEPTRRVLAGDVRLRPL